MSRVSNKRAIDEMRAQRVFDNNNSTLKGVRRFRGWGALPEHMRFDNPETGVNYWVYSYETPIAWVTDAGYVACPDVAYRNPETKNHQEMVERAFDLDIAEVERNLDPIADFVDWLARNRYELVPESSARRTYTLWNKRSRERLLTDYESRP